MSAPTVKLLSDGCGFSGHTVLWPQTWSSQSTRHLARIDYSRTGLKENIEIGSKAPVAFAKKTAIVCIGRVPMGGFRIEMVGQVEPAH